MMLVYILLERSWQFSDYIFVKSYILPPPPRAFTPEPQLNSTS